MEVIKLAGVSKKYKLYSSKKDRMKEALHPFKKKFHKDFFALQQVNLKVQKGEILGIVGQNGCGKSTLLKLIAGIIPPSSGTIHTTGNIVPLLELGAGFNPDFTGLENIYFYNSILGYSKAQTDQILPQILEFAEIGDFIHQPLKTYSSGMKARLAFSVSANINPDILILDEVLSVGDELFRRKCYAKMNDFFNGGKTILFVSHSAESINQICSRAILLHRGQIILDGPPRLVTMYYQKLLYSKPDNSLSVLNEIDILNQEQSSKSTNIPSDSEKSSHSVASDQALSANPSHFTKPGDTKLDDGYYIEEFQSKTSIIQKNGHLDIFETSILTLDGRKVNHLVVEGKYKIRFKVRFLSNYQNVVMGIGIKDEKGLMCAGLSTRNSDYVLNKVLANDVILAEWSFICAFSKGIYYVDIGIHRSETNDVRYLAKYDDVLIFKVYRVEKDVFYTWGFVDLNLNPKLTFVSTPETD